MKEKKNENVEIQEEEYYQQRCKQINGLKEEGMDIYPHYYEVKNLYDEILSEAEICEKGSKNEDKVFQSAGRIVSIRQHTKVNFINVMKDNVKLQLTYFLNKDLNDNLISIIRRNDIIGFSGKAGRTRTGQTTLFVDSMKLLSPCLRNVPSVKNVFTNLESIYRQRYLDLIVNNESIERFKTRSKIVRFLRNYFDNNNYIEVETPILNVMAGGATARPFKTFHNELKMNLDLRIAPELYLKELVVGGLDRVYELGRVFRNEGIDLTHNPEFTALEFYTAYMDMYGVIDLIEDLFPKLVFKIKNSFKFKYEVVKNDTNEIISTEIDFTAPFQRFDIIETLSKELDLELTGENIETEEMLNILIQKCRDNNIEIFEPFTPSRILDYLIGHFIEPRCINPSFITGHPVCMSPLAKVDRNRKGITERMELFVMGKELVNAYTELNMPDVQRSRFIEQASNFDKGDDEAMPADEEFCKALEYGLPPTAGCGIGIDRLTMFLTNCCNIKDVILFPTMKPETSSQAEALTKMTADLNLK
ncbi:SYKC [Hepatospora eriocheir]|uniref:Lysine--tRNA ligase n=1 Tax=Hepatospora eriocheir TaxID=1081669 RepID=A0A1X0QK40_9MICR|nr:SYKC [Hepatospora eriocheir]